MPIDRISKSGTNRMTKPHRKQNGADGGRSYGPNVIRERSLVMSPRSRRFLRPSIREHASSISDRVGKPLLVSSPVCNSKITSIRLPAAPARLSNSDRRGSESTDWTQSKSSTAFLTLFPCRWPTMCTEASAWESRKSGNFSWASVGGFPQRAGFPRRTRPEPPPRDGISSPQGSVCHLGNDPIFGRPRKSAPVLPAVRAGKKP
jgi:hypothetical protein